MKATLINWLLKTEAWLAMYGACGVCGITVTVIWLVQATASALWHVSVTLRGTGAPPLRRSPQNGRCRTFRNAVRAMEENVGRGAGDE